MKNFFKLIGIITLTTVIGFSMAACGEALVIPETGKLTIIGFDFTDNKYLVEADAITADNLYLFAVKSYNVRTDEVELGIINNRRVTLAVWEHRGGQPTLYSGSDEDVTFTVYVFDTEDPAYDPDNPEPQYTGEAIVTFLDGIGIAEIGPITAW
jgi:hypothetical protein